MIHEGNHLSILNPFPRGDDKSTLQKDTKIQVGEY